MDPALAGILGGSLVVLGMGAVFAAIVWGRSTRQAEIDSLRGFLEVANASIEAERARYLSRAKGSVGDLRRAAALAAAAAGGDVDGVLEQFPGRGLTGTAPTPSESGKPPEPPAAEDAHA